MVLKFQNLGPDLVWNDCFTLLAKTWISRFQTQIGCKQKLNNKIKPFKISQNHDKIEKTKISYQAYTCTQGTLECD